MTGRGGLTGENVVIPAFRGSSSAAQSAAARLVTRLWSRRIGMMDR